MKEDSMMDRSKRLAQLPAEKLEYLRQQLKFKRGESFPLRPQKRETNIVPLSFGQEGLWFLEQLDLARALYNITTSFRFTRPLNLAALTRSLNEIVRRHEALRTTFIAVDGQPFQLIAPSLELPLPVIDLRSLPQAEQEAEARRLAAEEARHPFNLAQGPLLRTTLLWLAETDYLLLLTIHHIISDDWSIAIFRRELETLYGAFAAGQPSPLPELPLQYADFALWQRHWLQEEAISQRLTYWRRQLADLPALSLPVDYPRPVVQSFRGARYYLALPSSLVAALRALSQQEEATLFMTLLAAFQALLARYTGQKDIGVGVPIANRNRVELEGLIGLFLNSLVLRTDLSGNPSFRELLGRVRRVALEAYNHQDLPFEKLVEALQPERDLSHTPLFQVLFQLFLNPSLGQPGQAMIQPGWEIDPATAKFDLSLHLKESSQGIEGYFEYSTDLFEAATISRMAGHFLTLLEGIAANPDQSLSDLPLLTEMERRQLLVEWNETGRDYPKTQCLHQLFEVQVRQTPEAVALVFEGSCLTYSQLDLKANQLAHYLQKLGVGPESLVGICLERSMEMIVAVLGVLKAGGAYLPLDPAYPPERLAFMLEDGTVGVLLTQQRLIQRLPEPQAQVVCLDTEWAVIAQEPGHTPASRALPGNLAYVIYTSGSTGKPKGVAIAHYSPVALLDWAKTVFTSDDLAGVLASTSICFDLSIFEIFLPLSQGGKIILVENLFHLPACPAIQEVTLINTVPSLMAELLRVEPALPALRVVNLAGEPLQNPLVQQIYRQTAARQVFNLYGPSEDTTYSTFALIKETGGKSPSIGRPIANTQVYILDQNLQPMPVGIPGELYLGGEGLARGYLNRPELTAQKFIPNPFGGAPGMRLYKTGDLVRYGLDGKLEFLGRLDHQVKIRGFRVELGEIEVVLSQHPAVKEVVVVAREDKAGDKRLVAYLVAGEKSSPSSHNLRRFIQAKLPDYMIPSSFMSLEALPLSPNGKVNRRALPAPDDLRPSLDVAFVAPRTPIETELAQLWGQLLDLDQIGIHDNFFDLGGHSLLATRVIARLRETFQVELPLRRLFETPTIADLAVALVQSQLEQTDQDELARLLAELEQ